MSKTHAGSRREEFEALALPLAEILYATAYRMTGHAAQAEDLVQEAFVRAWQNFSRFQAGTNFKAWVFKIMIFVHKNERRSAKMREHATDFSDGEMPLEAPPPADEHSASDWEALYPDLVEDEFKRALDTLDAGQREVLLLVTLGELSYEETAHALEIPAGTVMSRLFRARKKLQEELAEFARARGILKEKNAAAQKEAAG